MTSPRCAVVVLAAGEGTRMRSSTAKVLHPLGGRSLLGHALSTARSLCPDHLVVVVRHSRDDVVAHLAEIDPEALVADQDEVKGTGRAVWCGLQAVPEDYHGTVVVTYGDVPLLGPQTLAGLVEAHTAAGAAVSVLVGEVPDPTGYGRVVRDADGAVLRIVEDADADPTERAIREINSGIYAFDGDFLRAGLAGMGTDNAQGEMYLTDILELARAKGAVIVATGTPDRFELEGVNDRVQLAAFGRELNRRLLEGWMRAGVTVVDPASTWVDVDVRLAPDVTLLPGVQLRGDTSVETDAVIGPDTTLVDCEVAAGAHIVRSHALGARIGEGASVGPFSYLRPGTALGSGGKIGGFVETKNAVIGEGSKVPHLSYVGDATIGAHVNIGAATVFVNYDGVRKHRTVVGDHARVGSDTMLVAPVTIGDGAYTAAGSVIDEDVPPGALGVARGRQRNVEGWVARRRPGSAAATAAERASAAGAASENGSAADAGEQREGTLRP